MGFKSPETARGNAATSSRRRPGGAQPPNARMSIEKYLVPQVKAEVDEQKSKSDIALIAVAAATAETTATTTAAATTATAAATTATAAAPTTLAAETETTKATATTPASTDNIKAEVSVGTCHQTSANSDDSNGCRQKENVPETEAAPKGRKRVRMARKKRPTTASATSSAVTTTTTRKASTSSKSKAATSKVSAVDSKEKFITDYFQPRRSRRRTKAEVLKSNQMLMEEKIVREDETGFEIVKFEDKGRGVVSMFDLKAGDFVLEYAGDLIDLKEARRREEMYAHDTSVGCYMYYFQHETGSYCVDATRESTRLGRLINHSIKGANLKTRSVKIGGKPRLIFLAKRDICSGEELLYDYGDRSKLSLQSHPWLKN